MEILEKLKADVRKLKLDSIKVPAKCVIYFILGLVLSTGSVMGQFRPFGISITAVSKKRYFIF